MPEPILASKLYPPPSHPKLVLRPHLITKLNEGLHGKLTLISTPAGSGKTTLLAEWIVRCERMVAWLSLDPMDSDLTRFLSYLVAALQKIAPDIGTGLLKTLQSPGQAPTEIVLTHLLNDLHKIEEEFILILDDYHLIDAGSVDNVLGFLLDYLPPQMHLVIATREDPDIPLARLRVEGQLTELRASDLRFSGTESAEFLNQAMGLRLGDEAIDTLALRTEGWIAGLQLAAISLQEHPDKSRFIDSFSGSHRFVLDYLVEEVLQQQPETIRNFLLYTSILERLNGALCDAILPVFTESGQDILHYLERTNLLIVPLDDRREWYRYHHLFVDVLRVYMAKEHADMINELHRRAATWYEQHNFRSDAIYHTLAAQDFEQAANLLEQEWTANNGSFFRSAIWTNRVQQLPDDLLRSRVTLNIGMAWDLLFQGDLQSAECHLNYASDSLGSASSLVPNDEKLASQHAFLALARAFLAQATGDNKATTQHALQALKLLSDENHYMLGLASSLAGLAHWTRGDLKTAASYLSEALKRLKIAGSLIFAISSAYVLAEIKVAQGHLFEAINVYTEVLQAVTKEGDPLLPGTADLHLGLSRVYREQAKVSDARHHLTRCELSGKTAALPAWPYDLYIARARIKEDEGEFEAAHQLLEAAGAIYQASPVPDLRPIGALKTRVLLRQGRLDEALAWVHGNEFIFDGELNYLHEFEYITVARVLITCYASDYPEKASLEVSELLGRLLQMAEKGDRANSQIEILILQALYYRLLDDMSLALSSLKRALILAEPEGYVRIFIDEAAPMEQLLSEALEQGIMPELTSSLLAVFETEAQKPVGDYALLSPQLMVENLSERELEVLKLIAQGFSNQEIARQLVLALSTIKGHNQRIFGKLQVKRRTEAVARARELGLL